MVLLLVSGPCCSDRFAIRPKIDAMQFRGALYVIELPIQHDSDFKYGRLMWLGSEEHSASDMVLSLYLKLLLLPQRAT